MRKIIRNMRKSNFIEALFPKIRRGILATTYNQPERWWYLSEIAERLETAPSSLQRELKSLSKNGVLRTKREGNRLYFQAETNSPVFYPLQELMKQTLGVIPAVEEAILQFANNIEFSFFYGSVAKGMEHTLSDVDLMIIGEIGMADIASSMRKIENKFEREININCYQEDEFKKKLQKKNHFLSQVINKEKIFIKGNIGDFNRFVKQ